MTKLERHIMPNGQVWPGVEGRVLGAQELFDALVEEGYEVEKLDSVVQSGLFLPLYKPRNAAELEHFFDYTMERLHINAKGYAEGFVCVPSAVESSFRKEQRQGR